MTCLGFISRSTVAALVAAACLSSTTTSAFADSYDVYIAGPQHDATALGVDSTGRALIYSQGFESYLVYDHGNLVSSSPSGSKPTSFVPDNGSGCTISYGGTTHQGVCNNGYEAFGGHNIDNPLPRGLYVGHDGVFTDLIADAPLAFVDPPFLFLNSSGDVVFLDQQNDTDYQAYNTTTPEPSSCIFLLTGVGLAFAAHRRLLS